MRDARIIRRIRRPVRAQESRRSLLLLQISGRDFDELRSDLRQGYDLEIFYMYIILLTPAYSQEVDVVLQFILNSPIHPYSILRYSYFATNRFRILTYST